MKRFDGRVAAITGAGSGIGRALAEELARRGAHLAVSDVDEVGLAETVAGCEGAAVKVTSQRVDVADRAAVHAWADQVVADHGAVNLVVNNAGVALSATVVAMSYDDLDWVVRTNLWGVVHGTKAFLPHLKAAGEGHVVNISSVFGLIGVPSQSAYNASKFAVRGFTDALRMELDIERCGVSATTVHPGGIRTNIARNARFDPSAASLGGSPEIARRNFDRVARTSPAKAARRILAAVEHDRRRVLVGPDATLIDLIARLPAGLHQRALVAAARHRAPAKAWVSLPFSDSYRLGNDAEACRGQDRCVRWPSGLLTDLYELTMGAAYVVEGMAEAPATFSCFVREMPASRGYLVAAGLDSTLGYLEALRFDDDALAYLDGLDMFRPEYLDELARLRFTGSVRAMPEGTIAFGAEPLLEITAPILEAQLVETVVLNQITTETTLASKAARYRHAARDRAVVDFGFRRAQGVDAGMKLVRAVAICGLAGTSNVAGARRYGVPLGGTMAHSYVQAHVEEIAAFHAFAGVFGPRAVLLVDTYDTHQGIEHAIEVARAYQARGVELRGIRLDSGDLAALARHARARLDEAGLSNLQVLASGGLDEHLIERLVDGGAPIDGFGVGSDLGASADAAVLDTVYKLVAFAGRPVRKLSPGKATWPGAKQVWRSRDWSGDVVALADEPSPIPDGEPLVVEVMRDGERTDAGRATLADANAHFERQWPELPAAVRRLRDPGRMRVAASPAVQRIARDLDARLQQAPGDDDD